MKSGGQCGIRNGMATHTFEQIQQARREWENRITVQKLADKYGVPINTMRNWLRYNSRIDA